MSVVMSGSVAAKSCSTEGGHYNTVQGKRVGRALDVLIELLQEPGNHLSSVFLLHETNVLTVCTNYD